MAYLILLIGIFLLIVNVMNWRRLKKVASQATPRYLQAPSFFLIRKLFYEWRIYALGNNTWRGRRGLVISVLVFLCMSFVNLHWLQFNSWLFTSIVIPVLFIMQIRIGRTMHRKYFEDGFPEILSVVNAAVSAGNSIHQALHRCGEGIDGELGETFNRIDRRLNLGEEPERVFYDAWRVYPYREFYFFIVVIQVSIQRGGQLRVLVSRLSRIINNSKNMARRKMAMTSEARSSAKIVGAIPLLFFFGMKYFSPENFNFVVHDPIGRYILYYAIGSEVLGMLIIWILIRRAT